MKGGRWVRGGGGVVDKVTDLSVLFLETPKSANKSKLFLVENLKLHTKTHLTEQSPNFKNFPPIKF